MKKILFFSLVLFCSAGLFLMLYKPPVDVIHDALSDYHSRRGTPATIKLVECKTCSQNLPDSLAWNKAFDVASKNLDLSMVFAQLGDTGAYENAINAASACATKIDSIRAALSNRGRTKNTFIRCNYIATTETGKEHFSDTLTAILNDKMRVVWPD